MFMIGKIQMQIGIFARTFSRPTLSELLATIVQSGIESVQFNFSCVGLPTLPDRVDLALVDEIRLEFLDHKLSLAAVSGTFNMIHPDLSVRRDGLRRFKGLIEACAGLGTPVITLCTGTRDAGNMWRRHPENDSSEAWSDLLCALSEALALAEAKQITLGVESEPNNVISSARKARRLLDELKSPRLKIVMDAANLFSAKELPRMRGTLDEAFDLLGRDIVLAHAKDILMDGELRHVAAGKGLLDYDRYLSLLSACGYAGPLILHELQESEVAVSVAFLREKLRMSGRAAVPKTT
jgi:sugar phosphate isomerase/epimerase